MQNHLLCKNGIYPSSLLFAPLEIFPVPSCLSSLGPLPSSGDHLVTLSRSLTDRAGLFTGHFFLGVSGGKQEFRCGPG